MRRLTMQSPELQNSSDIPNKPCKTSLGVVDSKFQKMERLFHRISGKKVRDGHPLPECFALRKDGISVNRGKYSRARCMLCEELYDFRYPVRGSAVATLTYSALPSCTFPDIGHCCAQV